MTEAEWLNRIHPKPMLEFLSGRASERKWRLFACGCVRQLHYLCWPGADAPEVIEVGEAFADGQASPHEIEVARRQWSGRGGNFSWSQVMCAESIILHEDARAAAERALGLSAGALESIEQERVLGAAGLCPVTEPVPSSAVTLDVGLKSLAALLRDVFGNPFRPAEIEPRWLTSEVVSVARAIYDHRAFDRMGELAEALEWADCTDPDIWEHCRGPGPHVRGCWVFDLILGKR